jgi:hypothetical protein
MAWEEFERFDVKLTKPFKILAQDIWKATLLQFYATGIYNKNIFSQSWY